MTVTVGSSAALSLSPGGAAATLTVTLPGGGVLSPSPTVTATAGAFTATLDTTQPGRHLLTWYVPAEDSYTVDILDVGPVDPRYLVSVDDAIAEILGTVAAQNPSDAMKASVPLYVATATTVIEWLAGPVLLATKTKVATGGRPILLPASPVTVLSVTSDGSVLSPSTYVVDSEAGVVHYVPTSTLMGVTVSYQVGSTSVAANLQMATLKLVKHLWSQSRQSGRPGAINAATDTVQTPFGFAIPRAVAELCQIAEPTPGFA